MTKQEFDNRNTELYAEYKRKRNALLQEYVMSNARAKIGDTITDKHGHSIIVKYIGIAEYYGSEIIYYNGVKLNKNGQPNKKGDTETIYDERLTSINGNLIA